MHLIEDKDRQLEIINRFISDFCKVMSEHYIFPKIKDVFTYTDSVVTIEGDEKLKVELNVLFENCTRNDEEFFITRIYSQIEDIRNKFFDNNNLFITHFNPLEEANLETVKRLCTPNNFKLYLRYRKINDLLDE